MRIFLRFRHCLRTQVPRQKNGRDSVLLSAVAMGFLLLSGSAYMFPCTQGATASSATAADTLTIRVRYLPSVTVSSANGDLSKGAVLGIEDQIRLVSVQTDVRDAIRTVRSLGQSDWCSQFDVEQSDAELHTIVNVVK